MLFSALWRGCHARMLHGDDGLRDACQRHSELWFTNRINLLPEKSSSHHMQFKAPVRILEFFQPSKISNRR